MLVKIFNDKSKAYESVADATSALYLRQPVRGVEVLHGLAMSFRDPLRATGDELANDIGASFVLASNKSLTRLREKSFENDSDGDDITDYVRGSIMIQHWKQVESLRKLTQPEEGGGAIEIAGNRLVYYADNFASPLENGMRRLMQKYDIPVISRDGANDNTRHHIGEIQARVEAMKDAEDLTHRIYRMKREFKRMAKELMTADPALSHRLTVMANHCQDLIKPIHDLEAMRHGYDVLITEPYDPATTPTPNNPILKILMREKGPAAQLQPILKMTYNPRRNGTNFILG